MSATSDNRLFELLVETANTYIHLPYANLDRAIAESMRNLGSFIGADRIYLFAYDFERQIAINTHEWCAEGIEPMIEHLQATPMEYFPDWLERHRNGETMKIADVDALKSDTLLKASLQEQGIRSMIAVPMMDGDHALGFIGLDWVRQHHDFSDHEETLLLVFAKMLVNVRRRYEAQKSAEQEILVSKRAVVERLKELNCVYSVTKLGETPDLTCETYLHRVLELLPLGFLEPEQTSARIGFDGKDVVSSGFRPSPQVIAHEIRVAGVVRGHLEAHVAEGTEVLPEEASMLMAISQTMGSQIERMEAEIRRRASEDRIQNLLLTQTNYVLRTDLNGFHTYWNPHFEQEFGWLYSNNGLSEGDSLASICSYHHDRAKETVMQCLRQPGTIHKVELDKPAKDGTIMTTLWEFVALTDAAGNPVEMQCVGIDITDRVAMEQRLQASEAKYKSLFDDSPDGYLIIVNGRFVECNRASCELIGGDRSDLIGKTPADLSPEIQPNARRSDEYAASLLNEAVRKGSVQFEWQHRRLDGSLFTALVNLNLIDYEGGPALLVTWRDITESKLAQLDLLKFRTISEQSYYGSAIASLEGNLLYVNPVFAELHGYSVEEMTGMNLVQLHSETQLPLVMNLVGRIQSEGGFTLVEVGHMRKDWSEFPTLMSAKLIHDEHGSPLYMSATVIDITEKKEQEREINKLRMAIEQSPVAIVITDLDANIQYVSPAFETITGYSFEDVKGRNCRMLSGGATDLAYYKQMWDTITRGEPWQGEWLNRKKNEETYWESVTITPICDENGAMTSYLAIKTDISERKRAEQEILELNQTLEQKVVERTREMELARNEAEKANQAKSEFLSRMSHELRTPMNSILGFAQLMEMGTLTPQQEKGVGHILRSGRHLLQLINEVLDISRIEAGRMSISLEPVRLREVLQEVMDLVSPFANNQSIQLNLDLPDPGLHVRADRQRFKQVMLNLLNNGIKYNHVGGHVAIRVRSAGEQVRIEVVDSGIGIEESDLFKLFTPFERIGAEKTDTEGTGLGLTVVKKLMDVMNGRVGVDSVYGKGSTFWLELPRCEGLESAMDGVSGSAQTAAAPRQGTILYVEDNASNIDLVEQILLNSRPGARLITTLFGRDALPLAKESQPDLILLDLNLPDIPGWEVLAQLQADSGTRHIPVVVISADAMPDTTKKLLQNGAKSYLTKPLDVGLFLDEVDHHLPKP